MRALRIPLPVEVPAEVPANPAIVPAWIIDGERRDMDDRREAPRLEVPRLDVPRGRPPSADDRPEQRERDGAEPQPGSTVIVIPL
jgi:hypothetical protein